MEYIDLIKKYWKMNEENPLNSSVAYVYLFLLEVWDRKERKDFDLSDAEIVSRLKISRTSVKSSKQILRNLGLISYQLKDGYPTLYKIFTDCVIDRKQNSVVEKEKSIDKKNKKNLKGKPIESKKESFESEKISSPEETKKKEEKKTASLPKNISIPSLEEFMSFAKTLNNYDESLDSSIKNKYSMWKDAGWTNAYNIPILNWRQSLEKSLVYMKKPVEPIKIPVIKKPKQTYNE